jgi:uncharacterized repeat protein (TIGR01451 family)
VALHPSRQLLTSVVLFALLAALYSPLARPSVLLAAASSPSTTVLIAEFAVAGATSADEYVELYNASSAAYNLRGHKLVYRSASGTSDVLLKDFGTVDTFIPAKGHYLIAHATGYQRGITPDATFTSGSTGSFAATAGGIGIQSASGVLIDSVGYGTATNILVETKTIAAPSAAQAAERKPGGSAGNATDTNNNFNDLLLATPNPQNSSATPPPTSTDVAVTVQGPASYSTGLALDYTITVTVSTATASGVSLVDTLPAGTSYVSDNTGVTPTISGQQVRWSLGNLVVGSRAYTLRASVGGGATGSLTNSVSVSSSTPDSNAANNSASSNAAVQVTPIGSVQGIVPATGDVSAFASPVSGQVVKIRGVIYELIKSQTSGGTVQNGFLIQNPRAAADMDSATSDGIFVFLNTAASFADGYVPAIGDDVIIQGTVGEYFNNTRLTSPALIQRIGAVSSLNSALPPTDVTPPDSLIESYRVWEKLEGMRVQLPAGAKVISSQHSYASSNDTEFYAIRGDHPFATRTDAYARRVFRDAHALDGVADGNGMRVLLTANGLKGASGSMSTQIAPGRTYDTLSNAAVGGVYYAFNKYSIQVETQPLVSSTTAPDTNNAPQAATRATQYAIASFNVENLYEYLNDPFDTCDFASDTGSGCPGVQKPFDYVPASQAAYQKHLGKLALAVINKLHAPDILLIQETEDQDICVSGGQLYGTCGSTNNADGKPDSLHDLAREISSRSGGAITYAAAFDRNSADERGITLAYLYRTDRVELLPAQSTDPLLGSNPRITVTGSYSYATSAYAMNDDVSNPKSLQAGCTSTIDCGGSAPLYDRAAQVALFRVHKTTLSDPGYVDLYLIDNHFKSNPDSSIERRTQQAQFAADLAKAVLSANANARVAVGGDLNVFPAPDSNQLAALHSALNTLYSAVPASGAFSYVFEGQSQTLDHIFASNTLNAELVQARFTHINADYPESASADGTTPYKCSDHDPLYGLFRFP